MVEGYDAKLSFSSSYCVCIVSGSDAEILQLTTAHGDALHVHVVCKSVSAIHNIDELSIAGQLAHLLQNACTDLLDTDKTVTVSEVVWQPADYVACVRYFHTKLGEKHMWH